MQRLATITISLSLAIAGASSLRAQAARVGRLPVLQPPPHAGGTCLRDTTDAQLRSAGIVHTLGFSMEDGNRHRFQSIGVDSAGKVRMLMAMMGTRQERRGESERVTVFFGPNGSVVRALRKRCSP
jgi:hypothetical protein